MKRLLVLFTLLFTLSLQAEPRTALVMGVWDYSDPSFDSLKGIELDVKAMKEKLEKELGFEVVAVTNPTLGEAKEAVDLFGAKLKARGGVGLFYFSGHGAENGGKNYLIPRGTSLSRASQLDDQALSANRVIEQMENSGAAVNMLFLDCCRNAMTKGTGTGLAAINAAGVFVGFSTGSGKESFATSKGSPYTIALLKHLATPGLSITDMHSLVTDEVVKKTSQQNPFQSSGIRGIFKLAPGDPVQPPPVATASIPAPAPSVIPAPVVTHEQPRQPSVPNDNFDVAAFFRTYDIYGHGTISLDGFKLYKKSHYTT